MLNWLLAIIVLFTVAQQIWVLYMLLTSNPRRTLANHLNRGSPGVQHREITETEHSTIEHIIENGIERIIYRPKKRRFETPILMQHGMWHGAWCWQHWQELLAEWGWESHALSLPGHAGSQTQRPAWQCTLDYYLGFLKAEIGRLEHKPILMGHSMGGALTQWYLRHIGELPSAVLVAPWMSHSSLADGLPRFWLIDPIGCFLVYLTWNAGPFVRNPYHAARKLITEGAIYTPEQLHSKLGTESALVMLQHNPPFWTPAQTVTTPMLWLAGEKDAVCGEPAERRSAAHYNATYHVIPKAGHNLMMEASYRQTGELIHNWLVEQRIP